MKKRIKKLMITVVDDGWLVPIQRENSPIRVYRYPPKWIISQVVGYIYVGCYFGDWICYPLVFGWVAYRKNKGGK